MPALASPAAEFVNWLRCRGVRLHVDGSKLKASPKTLLTDDDRATIRERKAELLTLLATPTAGAGDITPPIPEENEGYVTSANEFEAATADPLPIWPDWLWDAIDHLFPVNADGRTLKTKTVDWLVRYDRPLAPWSGDDATLIDWFESHRKQLPAESFELKPGVRVVEPSKFLRALSADIQAGSNGPRVVGLLNDLKWLRDLS